jgi:thiosulfate/3-mercaptopyruvate sulfurtransferase
MSGQDGYVHALVSTQWAADHLHDPSVRFIEIGFGSNAYEEGHLPKAAGWLFKRDLLRTGQRDLLSKSEVEARLSSLGVSPDTLLVLYDDAWGMLAAMGYWMLTMYGHSSVRVMDGGRQKWVSEGRLLSQELPDFAPVRYVANDLNADLRASRDDVMRSLGSPRAVLVDARPADMYSGGNAAGAQYPGHIPGAINIPAAMIMHDGAFQGWSTPTTHPDGTYKPRAELLALFTAAGVTPDKEIITYCVGGGLSTHMWFALKVLLQYPHVREYDGSWAEWGNLVGAPIEA